MWQLVRVDSLWTIGNLGYRSRVWNCGHPVYVAAACNTSLVRHGPGALAATGGHVPTTTRASSSRFDSWRSGQRRQLGRHAAVRAPSRAALWIEGRRLHGTCCCG